MFLYSFRILIGDDPQQEWISTCSKYWQFAISHSLSDQKFRLMLVWSIHPSIQFGEVVKVKVF